MTAKRPHWPELFSECVEGARNAPWKWGVHDCCMFAADVVLAMTGTDPAAGLRGRYSDKRGAALALRAAGFDDLERCVESLAMEHDFCEIAPLTAQRGDLVLVDQPGGPALGVCEGQHAILATKPRGWIAVPMLHERVRRAWGVD